MKYVMAFDVSKGRSVVVLYDSFGNLVFEKKLLHSQSGFKDLKEQIEALLDESGQGLEIVFESTGVYSSALERFLQENNYAYYRLNPLEAHFQTMTLRRNKTDKSDAHELAKSHLKAHRYQTYQQDEYYEKMRVKSRRYGDIDKETIRYKNRLHSLIHLSFPELDDVFETKSTLYFKVIQIFSHPNNVLNHSKTIIKNRIKKCTRKNYSLTQLEERTLQLIKAAQNSYPAIDEDDYRCDLIKLYARKILEFAEEQDWLIKEMAALSQDRKEYRVLLSFPGIQETTACRLIGELGDLNRFENHKQLNAYAGIDIVRYQSGNIQHKERINKRGNSRLRSILFFMLGSMLSAKDKQINHFTDYYFKLKKQPYNKHHKVAIVACMNKFLKVAFHLIQHDILYDYESATLNS